MIVMQVSVRVTDDSCAKLNKTKQNKILRTNIADYFDDASSSKRRHCPQKKGPWQLKLPHVSGHDRRVL